MKYSFYCNKCGFSFMSDDKSEVVDVKKEHKLKMLNPLTGERKLAGGCDLKPTSYGTWARADLIPLLEANHSAGK